MNKSRCTQEKWEIVEDDFGDESELMLPSQIVATDKKKIIALVGGHLTDYDEPHQRHEGHYQRHDRYVKMFANARLISKAPELLEALEKMVVDKCDKCTAYDESFCKRYNCPILSHKQLIAAVKGEIE